MNNDKLSYSNDEEILKHIKEVILNRHPIVENRLDILYPHFDQPRTPEMKIIFSFFKIDDENITQVSFMDGTRNFKTSIPEEININGLISKKVICDFIHYLLTDHDYFENIVEYDTSFEISMNVDGRDDNMHGISCGKIDLKFDFWHHPDNHRLLNEYLKFIVTTFYENLKETSTIKEKFSNYCDLVKDDFINSLTSEELKSFISLLNNNDLCNLIYSLPNNRFIELYHEYNNQKKMKKLTRL